MSIFSGIVKIAASPLVGAVKVVADISGKTSEEEQGLSILTLGASSIIKGATEAVAAGLSDIYQDEE